MKLFKDLNFLPHHIGEGVHAKETFPNGKWVSVVGGSRHFYGDGVNTWEVMTSEKVYDVFSHLSIDEVNNVLLALQLGDEKLFPKFKLQRHSFGG